MPHRTLSPWCPPEGALDKAREAWEKNGYLGLGWNKEKMDDAYAKLKI
jgi:hypothetical protein